MRGFRLPPRWS